MPSAPRIAELIPWQEFTLPRPPWDDSDCFNPSILRVPGDSGDAHAGRWLCSIRGTSYPGNCPVDHHWPGRPGFRSHHHDENELKHSERSHCSHTRNWMWMLDAEQGWAALDGREIKGTEPLSANNYVGYEDLRLAWSPDDGLIASGTTLMHNTRGAIEIVVLDLDAGYQIRDAAPVRGWWSNQCQKNWSPFLGQLSVKWLYSPAVGGVVDRLGQGLPEPRKFSASLCGGTQLVPTNDPGYFLGLGHSFEVLPPDNRYYWHRAFIVNTEGELMAQSRPFKLSEHVVDFASGLAIDPHKPDRLVVTYGVGNTVSRLAETSFSAMLWLCADEAVTIR